MLQLCCKDYGFDCEFIVQEENASKVIETFMNHTSEVHGIDYSKEALMQFVIRKTNYE
ncbi:MAG TPA: DUF1059 domain-containing protein [Nitrosopumilaceae archaeon]|nr:DUF1059 domain-containing protein [Nitrosopumilaceae archaeon]